MPMKIEVCAKHEVPLSHVNGVRYCGECRDYVYPDSVKTITVHTRNDEAARQAGAEDAVMKSGIMQLKIDSAVAIARQEEREAIKELINEFFDIYESDGVEFWVETDSDDGAENIYKRFQNWKERAEAIRKRGEK